MSQNIKMISWMQKHKKYLVITLWISAISFIGAGFVGWGSYHYGSKSRSIAKVGDVEISFADFQLAYSNLYSYYTQMFNGEFDEEKAKMFKLKENAFQILKSEALLLNLAHFYGLKALDEEVATSIVTNSMFFENGKFDKQKYLDVLRSGNFTPKEYEERIAKTILITKLQDLLHIQVTPFEQELITSLTKLQDKIKYRVLTPNDVQVNVSDAEVKNYWEQNKNQYLTPEAYKISYIQIPIVERNVSNEELEKFYNSHALDYNGSFEKVKDEVKFDLFKKEAKKVAMKSYIAFKKGKFNGDISQRTIPSTSLDFPQEILSQLKTVATGKVLKPKLFKSQFVSVRLDEVIPPKIMPFEMVRVIVKNRLIIEKSEDILLNKAKKLYTQDFKGKISPFISLQDVDKIPELSPDDAKQLLQTIFTQMTNSGFLKLGSNVVIYKVVEQRVNHSLPDVDSEIMLNIKGKIFDNNLIKKLEQRYSVEIYFNEK
jgi:peptidyl-prolyl cis-trans isomerase D